MAHSPAFDSRPSTRFHNERRWLIVLAALAMFAYYVASGNYVFVPLQASQGAVSQTSSLRSEPVTLVQVLPGKDETNEAEVPAAGPALSAETSSAVAVVEEASPAVQQQAAVADPVAPAPGIAAAPPLVSAPAPAPAASTSTTSVVDRWRAAGIIIETQGQEWDEQSLANVDAALSALPASVRSQLGNPALGQLHILVNSQGRALSGKQPYGGSANFFSTGDGINELVMFPRQKVATILHELGHAYNLRRVPAGHYARVLSDPEMQSFLAATGWQVLATPEQISQAVDHMRLSYQYSGSFRWPEMSKFDPLEDFANSFAMYFYDPAGLNAQSPERHVWMAANLPR
jgi:hypothetical protein